MGQAIDWGPVATPLRTIRRGLSAFKVLGGEPILLPVFHGGPVFYIGLRCDVLVLAGGSFRVFWYCYQRLTSQRRLRLPSLLGGLRYTEGKNTMD